MPRSPLFAAALSLLAVAPAIAQIPSPKEVFSGKSDTGPKSLVFTAKGETLVSVWLNQLEIWEVATGQKMTFSLGDIRPSINASVVAPDGKHAALVRSDAVQIWDTDLRKMIGSIPVKYDRTGTAAFTADGKRLAVTNDTATTLYDVINFKELGVLVKTRLLAFPPDGTTLLAATTEPRVQVRTFNTGTQKERPGPSIALSADQFRIDYSGRFAYTPDGKTLVMLEIAKTRSPVKAAGITGVAEITTADLVLLNPATGKARKRFKVIDRGLSMTDYFFILSPDGKRAAVRGDNKGLKIWDIEAGVPVGHIDVDPVAFAFSPDSASLAVSEYAARSIKDNINKTLVVGGSKLTLWDLTVLPEPKAKK